MRGAAEIEDVDRDPKPTAARARSGGPRRAAPLAPEAAADIDKVVDLYCSELLDKGYDDPEYWWWPRAAWVDPNQLIVDGENGSLYRVGFSTDSQQNVTFAEPVEVLETFSDLAPAAKARALVAAAADRESPAPVRVYESRAASPAQAKQEPEGGVAPTGNNVGMTPEQLAAISLSADATQEQINARLAELAALEPDGGGEGGSEGGEGGEGSGEGEPAGGEGEGAPAGGEGEPAPAAGALPEGMVAVPADVWESVQTGAAAGAAVAESTENTNRDNTISAATASGKIAPSHRDSMVNLHARDKDAFYKLLTATVAEGGLAEGLIPVNQRGGAAQASAQGQQGIPGPGGVVPAAAGGDYVPPEKMVLLFGDSYAPPAANRDGMTVVGG